MGFWNTLDLAMFVHTISQTTHTLYMVFRSVQSFRGVVGHGERIEVVQAAPTTTVIVMVDVHRMIVLLQLT